MPLNIRTRLWTTALAASLQVAVVGPAQAQVLSDYFGAFQRALTAFDAGHFTAAADRFVEAGLAAPDAPVWRASAGLAAARAGERERAQTLFRAALAAGYPPSDLAALHPLGAEVARGAEPVVRDTWGSVTARGLRQIGGHTRHGRERGSDPNRRGHVTHVLGNFVFTEGRTPWPWPVRLDRYRVDAATGRFVYVASDENGLPYAPGALYSFGISSFGSDDALNPWPRALPFARAIRTGLLIDDLGAHVAGSTLSVAGVGRIGERVEGRPYVSLTSPGRAQRGAAFDLEQLAWCQAPEDGAAESDGLEPVDDEALLERARARFPLQGGGTVQLSRFPATTEGELGALYARRPLSAWGGRRAAASMPAFILDHDAQKVLCTFDVEDAVKAEYNARFGASPTFGAPIFDLRSGLFVTSHNARGGVLNAYHCADWRRAWTQELHHNTWAGCRLEVRDGLLCTWLPSTEQGGEVRRLADGELLLDGTPLGLTRFFVTPAPHTILGQGADSLFLFDARALAGGAPRAEPLSALWASGGGLVAVACDGTWALPQGATAGVLRVVLDQDLVPAQPLLPWLLDPLHVRTIQADEDLSRRMFPRPQ